MNDQELYYTVYVDDNGSPSVTIYDSMDDAITDFLLKISHDTTNPFEKITLDENLDAIIKEGIYFYNDIRGSVSWGKARRKSSTEKIS